MEQLEVELLHIQATMEGQEKIKDKSPEYCKGFLAGCDFIIAYTREFYKRSDSSFHSFRLPGETKD